MQEIIKIQAAERKELARRYTENAESWIRKLIHHQLSNTFGNTYLTGGNWKKKLVDHVTQKKKAHPQKFSREIDATTFDQAIDIICHPEYWDTHFKIALIAVYPLGNNEARFFLEQLKEIRNDVSHARDCSSRELEKAICYSNDLADSIKDFFTSMNKQRAYNVPMIVKYVDNFGNRSDLTDVSENINTRIIDFRSKGHGDLHPGDTLIAEVEVDPSFNKNEYDVSWNIFGFGNKTGNIANVQITNQHVGEQMELGFQVISKKDWHRQHGVDDLLSVVFRVLPPPD